MSGISPIFFGESDDKPFMVSLIYFLLALTAMPASAITTMYGQPVRRESVQERIVDDSTRVNSLIAQFRETLGNDLSVAEEYVREALQISKTIHYSKGLIQSHRGLADIHRMKGRFEQASLSLQEAIALSEQDKDEVALAQCFLDMYKLFFAQGNYPKAGEFNKQAQAIGERAGHQEIMAEVHGNEGIRLGINGKHVEAIGYFLKSLELYKVQRNELMTALTLTRIGHTFELAGSYDKALDYLNQSLELHRKLRNWSNTGWCLLNIGVTHSRIEPENYELKLDYYNQALVMAEKAGDFRLKLACLDNIGGAYSLWGDYNKANSYLNQAYKLSKSAGHNSRTVFITGNLAENYLYTGQLDSALIFGRENLKIALNEHNTFETRQGYSVLSRVYAARNDHENAYQMLLHHTKLSDSMFNVQKSRQIEDLREKYETEKKQQEIELLTRENAVAEFRRNTFAALAGLFLAIGLLVFAVLKLRVKKKQILLQKEIELDRMKSRFFANISHEFRTPLTLILGPIDEMLNQQHQDGVKKYLRPMRRNAARLLDLVNQLLELSRIESGRLKPELTKNNIVSLTKGLGMSFDSLAEIKKIHLRVIAPEDPLEIFVDRDKIEKILVNLLANAFKFTPEEGSITIIIERTMESRLPGSAECLQLTVRDTGAGIPAEDLPHIFDRFYQADNNQLHQHDGSGIGLALTRELVELHNGAIWAQADMGVGTRICLQIPLNLEEVLEGCVREGSFPLSVPRTIMPESHDNSVDKFEIGTDGLNPIVLLIEDHMEVRKYIREILDERYNVLEASDGEAGIQVALDKIPDLILCDVMMPKKNGTEVCLYLKNEEKTSHIPIILLTAKADVESRIEGLETRADDYLTKPFVPRELMVRIQNLIESRKKLSEKYLRTLTLRPSEVTVDSIDEKFIKRMMDILELQMGDEKFGVEALGTELGMSRSQLHRKLKALIGQGPNQFIRSFRLNRAHDLLKVNAATAAEVAYSVGFSSPSYFTKCFHEQFGYTPSEIPL